MKGRGKYHRAFHVSNMGIFYLCLEILEDGYLNCWLSAPIPLSRANCFQYQIQFSKENDDAKVTFSSKVAPASDISDRGGLAKMPNVRYTGRLDNLM
ncbi:hypothetical protein J6590_012672 [Homalodisca vitripennis]|nr:hypothetical protein J6590_012672 [Homalodisca vitripennis]